MKVIVDNNYTYYVPSKLQEKIQVGTKVVLPTPDWLRDVKGATWEGTVTALTSTYGGNCASIIRLKRVNKKKQP